MKKLTVVSTLTASVLLAITLRPDSELLAAPIAAPASGSVPSVSAVTPQGTSAIPADWRATIVNRWRPSPDFGRVEAGDDGLKLVTTAQPEHVYSLQAQLLNRIKVAKGDTLLASIAARSLQAAKISGVTKLGVGFGKASPDWSSSLKTEIGLSSNWERYDFPFTCKDDFAPNEAQMVFQFGFPA